MVLVPSDRDPRTENVGTLSRRGWVHDITLAAVQEQSSRLTKPLCLDGARSGPPEDCGGPPGYEHLLKVLKKPKHREHARLREWVGDDCDPEAFDLAAVNRMLGRVKV
jgi:hypothetical protein